MIYHSISKIYDFHEQACQFWSRNSSRPSDRRTSWPWSPPSPKSAAAVCCQWPGGAAIGTMTSGTRRPTGPRWVTWCDDVSIRKLEKGWWLSFLCQNACYVHPRVTIVDVMDPTAHSCGRFAQIHGTRWREISAGSLICLLNMLILYIYMTTLWL